MLTTNQKEFVERFKKLLNLLKNIPASQLREIELNPQFNPRLDPQPSDIFATCFDWYLALPLIPGGSYGPFYRVDGDHFWPQDSDGANPFSEKKYFFGLEEPKNQKDAQEKYNMRKETPKDYVHEFTVDADAIGDYFGAEIYVGPVKGGTGYQFNANKLTAHIIRGLIVKNKIKKPKKLPKITS
ncbi:MAG: hypothetical protein ABIH50_03790 [bacterium]